MSITKSLLLIVWGVLLVQCSAAQNANNSAQKPEESRNLVDVGGRRLYINCTGEARQNVPTVILESGFGNFSSTWDKVQPEIAKFTRVCAYDRAGLGKSEPSGAPRTIVAVTEDLHVLLEKAKIPAPYVLVGHSLGGILTRLYASYYPKEVVGMVLVDSAHEDEADRGVALMPTDTLKDILRTAKPEDLKVQGQEAIDSCSIRSVMNALNWRGDIPLVVLTQGVPYRTEDYPNPSLAPKYYQLHLEMQKDLVNRSNKGKQVIAAKSGHFIHQDEPDLVINAVRQVVNEAKNK